MDKKELPALSLIGKPWKPCKPTNAPVNVAFVPVKTWMVSYFVLELMIVSLTYVIDVNTPVVAVIVFAVMPLALMFVPVKFVMVAFVIVALVAVAFVIVAFVALTVVELTVGKEDVPVTCKLPLIPTLDGKSEPKMTLPANKFKLVVPFKPTTCIPL